MKVNPPGYSHELFSSVAHYKDKARPPINHLSYLNHNGQKTPPVDPRTVNSKGPSESGIFVNCKHCLKARKTSSDIEGKRIFWRCSLGYTGSALTSVGNPTECLDFKESIARPLPHKELQQ